MTTRRFTLGFASAACLIGLAACSSNVPSEAQLKYNGQYWQRSNMTSALYLRGPKAQQILNQDISRCVNNLKELERLSAVREAVPAEKDALGHYVDPATPQGHLAEWDSPERDGYLYTEHLEYHDFETCMQQKGWERVEDLPYGVAEEARDNYMRTIMGRKYRSKVTHEREEHKAEDPDFKNLNK